MNTVAIVGGGITGLTVAFRLKERGIPVTLYEAGNRVGGAIQTTRRDGYLAESGPNSILETSPHITSLIHDVGLEDFKLYSDQRADKRYVARDGKLVQIPGEPLQFLATNLFSATAKAHLLAEPFLGRAPADEEESVEQFVLRRLGREFLDYAINPLVAGIYAGDPARLSVKHAFPKLHALEQKYGSLLLGQFLGARERKRRGEVSKQQAKKISFPGGLQDLVDALQHQIPGCIRLNSPIQELEEIPNGWRVFSKGGMNEYGAVVLAAPAYRLAQILLKTNSAPELPFEKIKYPPIASVVLGFRRDQVTHPLDGFGVLVPEVEHMNILGAIFSSSLFPNRAPGGHVAITCFVGGCRNPDLALIGKPALRHLILEDLKRLLGVAGSPTFEHYSIFPQSIPQYDLGFGKFKELMNRIEGAAPGLYFAGNYREGISVGDSIASAENATAKIVRHFNDSASHRSLNLTTA